MIVPTGLILGLAIVVWLSVAAIPAVPVKIGLVVPFSGRDAALGQQLLGATKLALKERGRAGVQLLPVELVAYDDAADVDQLRQQAEKLVADPQTVAVLGHPTLASGLAAGPTYQASQVATWLLATGLSEAQIASPIVPVGPNRATLAAAVDRFKRRQGVQNMLSVITRSPEAAELAGKLLPEGSHTSIQLDPERAESALAATLAERPDAVLYLGDTTAGSGYLGQLRRAGWSGPVLLMPSQGTAHEVSTVLGAAARNVYYLAPIPFPDTDPSFEQRFRAATDLVPWPEARLAYQLAAHLLSEVDAEGAELTKRRWWDASRAARAKLTSRLTRSDSALPKSGVGIFESVPGQFPGALIETVPPLP